MQYFFLFTLSLSAKGLTFEAIRSLSTEQDIISLVWFLTEWIHLSIDVKDQQSSKDLCKIRSLKTWWKPTGNWTVKTVYAKGTISSFVLCSCAMWEDLTLSWLASLFISDLLCTCSRHFCFRYYSFLSGNDIYLHLYLICVLVFRSLVR